MRIESPRPYGLPNLGPDAKETNAEKAPKLPERAVNLAGDQFELSSEQKVTQAALDTARSAARMEPLTPERLAEIRERLATGQYLTPRAADLTAEGLLDFHQ